MTESVSLDITNVYGTVPENEIAEYQGTVDTLHQKMERGEGPGSDFLGWLHLPSQISSGLVEQVKQEAERLRSLAEVFICIGIGGSYLGTRAALGYCGHTFENQLKEDKRNGPEVYFAGQNISSDHLSDLLDIVGDRSLAVNVISKSGTTTEPAIAFRILKKILEDRYGREGARERIVATTDEKKGALKELADAEGYATFVIPDDVGGRFSVLTPVGLLPISVAGHCIEELLEGARGMESKTTSTSSLSENIAYRYAVVRHALYKKGKSLEVMSGFHPALEYVVEWWKQLSGESEGKEGKGLFPASVLFTTDLHSLGQWVQEGQRNLFETFVTIGQSSRELAVPEFSTDADGLGYLEGKSLDFINEKAYKGTMAAHLDGGVPNMTLKLADRTPRTLGALFYFFERAIAMSGNLLGVNPFDQPGVEFYKRNMFRLLKKPGFEEE